jgi:hypothetical protein
MRKRNLSHLSNHEMFGFFLRSDDIQNNYNSPAYGGAANVGLSAGHAADQNRTQLPSVSLIGFAIHRCAFAVAHGRATYPARDADYGAGCVDLFPVWPRFASGC